MEMKKKPPKQNKRNPTKQNNKEDQLTKKSQQKNPKQNRNKNIPNQKIFWIKASVVVITFDYCISD